MKVNTFIIRWQFVSIAALIVASLNGCSNQLITKQEPETVIDFNSLIADKVIETQQESLDTEERHEFWYDQYAAILSDWTLAEDYGDLSYLPMYFGEDDYAFDSYWLCDVDQNGIPELFLHSSTMSVITAVFTCTEEQLVFLTYDDFYGINLETEEIVIQGHWHGAAGSPEYEWTAYKVFPDKVEYTMYIDFFDFSEDSEKNHYTIYNPETDEYMSSSDGTEYEELYAAHVEPCIPVENYTLYDISDLSGLDRIQ
ncbi:MAG: hypothetical protein K2N43_09680 [Lachnospiraceae bacterium]|nr:hypothetical protein [Lachnospiraceae bacterium]